MCNPEEFPIRIPLFGLVRYKKGKIVSGNQTNSQKQPPNKVKTLPLHNLGEIRRSHEVVAPLCQQTRLLRHLASWWGANNQCNYEKGAGFVHLCWEGTDDESVAQDCNVVISYHERWPIFIDLPAFAVYLQDHQFLIEPERNRGCNFET